MPDQKIIEIEAIPESIEAFLALRDQIALTPQGGAVMFVLALLGYAKDQESGNKYLTISVDRANLQEDPTGYKGWELINREMQLIRRQLGQHPYLPLSYFQNTSPQIGYALPAAPFTFAFKSDSYSPAEESGEQKIFIYCSGADSPRPISLRRNNRGIWKAYGWSSLLMGIRAPIKELDDDL